MFYMMRTIALTIIVSVCKNTIRSLVISTWLVYSGPSDSGFYSSQDYIHCQLGVRRRQLQLNENAGWIGHGISWRWSIHSIKPIGFSRVNLHFFAATSHKLSWKQYKMFSRFYRWISDRRIPSLIFHRFVSFRSSHLTKKQIEV